MDLRPAGGPDGRVNVAGIDAYRLRLIRRAAENLRERYRGDPPIDVGCLIELCGYGYRLADLGPMDGNALRVGQRVIIVINRRLKRALRRQAAAHELGHVVLGHLSLPDSTALEVEANHFAAELLAGARDTAAALREAARMLGVTERFLRSALAKSALIEGQRRGNGLDKPYAKW